MIKNKVLIDETIYTETLNCGLLVLIHPKPDFLQTVVTLQTNFGGGDIEYYLNDKMTTLPEGTAHFLEHVIFENNGRNLTEVFSKKGAEINAYTARSMTAYGFTCQSDFYYLLGYLLDSLMSIFPKKALPRKETSLNEN